MFKRFLKIFSLALAGVVSGVVLMVGIAYLSGAFKEKVVKPKDIFFAETQVTTSTAIDLRVNSSTKGITHGTLDLNASPAGIVKIPKHVQVGEDFIVFPEKDAEQNNIGGLVEITASFNGIMHSTVKVFVDVPVRKLEVTTEYHSLSKGDAITFGAVVYPERALNPGKLDLIPSEYDREKTIYYALQDAEGNLLSKEYAEFQNGAQKLGNVVTSKQAVGTVIYTKKECDFYLKAYMFKTFSDEEKYGAIEFDGKVNAMLGGVSSAQDDAGQLVVVADVYIDNIQATNTSINSYWFEQTTLVARKDAKQVDGFDLNIMLNPKENTSNYDYTALDYLMDNIVLEYYDGAPVTVVKNGNFTGTDPSKWTWSIVPTDYSDVDTTSRLKMSITYRTQGAAINTQTSEWFFAVNILTRPVSAINLKYNDQEEIELNSDDESENYIELEKDMQTQNDGGFIKNTYKYFEIKSSEGQPYSTFSLLRFYLPSTTVTIPSEAKNYKFTFEVQIDRAEQQYLLNSEGGTISGAVTYYKWDEGTMSFSTEPLDSIANLVGKFRVEGTFTISPNSEDPPRIVFTKSDGTTELSIKNVKYYEELSAGVFSIYPYVKVGQVRVYTELNTDTLMITSNLSKIMVNGYGSFDINAAVVVTSITGNPVADVDGNLIQFFRSAIKIKVTNSVKDVDLSIKNLAGLDEDYTGTVQGGNLELIENKQYILYIKNGATTEFEVLKQAYTSGNLQLAVETVYEQYKDSQENVINADSIKVYAIEEDISNGDLVGYKVTIEVNNVYTIELENGTRVKPTFNLKIWVDDSLFEETYQFTVQDIVITDATIKYAEENGKAKTIFATGYSAGTVAWTILGGNYATPFRTENLVFSFAGFNGVTIDETPEVNFVTETPNVNISGLIYLDAEKKLVIKNFPYNASGVKVRLNLTYQGESADMNSRYVFDGTSCVLRAYEDASDYYDLTIYGFKINYTPLPVANITGEAGKTINLATDTYSTRSIKNHRDGNVANVSINDLVEFNYKETNEFALTGTTIRVKTSLTKTTQIDVVLYVGSNVLTTHSLTFVSPYTVAVQSLYQKVEAPRTAIDLSEAITVLRAGQPVTTIVITFDDDTLSTGDKVSDFVTISASGGRHYLDIKNIPVDFDLHLNVEVFELEESKGVFTGNTIRVINKYNSEERADTVTEYARVGEDNTILAGKTDNTDILLTSSLLSGQTATNVEVSFDEVGEMYLTQTTDETIDNIARKLKSLHVAEDIETVITLKVTFQNAGYTLIDLHVTILKNLFIEFDRTSIAYGNSGLLLSDINNYKITDREGYEIVVQIDRIDEVSLYRVSEDAISQEYLTINKNAAGEVWLMVKKNSTEMREVSIVFEFEVYRGATVAYTIPYVLTINIEPTA